MGWKWPWNVNLIIELFHQAAMLWGINNTKNKKYHVQNPIDKSWKLGKTDTYTHNTQIHNRSLSWLGTGVSITCDGVKLFKRVQISPLGKWCDHASLFQMWVKYQPSHITGWTSVIYTALILNIMHNILNRRGKNVVICITLVLLRRVDVLIHYLDIIYTLEKIRVITKLPNSEQSYKGKVKTHNYINRQNQSTTGKLWKP
jgi:hypothetical protein